MDPGQLLFSLLSSAPAVVALAGTRIYPLRVPQNEPRPAITYQLISNATDSLLSCPGNEAPLVQVSLFVDDYKVLCALALAVRRTLHGYRSGQLTVDFENETDQPYEADAACFHRVLDFALDYPSPA